MNENPLSVQYPLIQEVFYQNFSRKRVVEIFRRCATFFHTYQSGFFTSFNTIVGAGILSFPFVVYHLSLTFHKRYAFRCFGLAFGLFFTVFVCGMVYFTIFVVISNADKVGAVSYQQIMEYHYGKLGKYVSLAFLLFYLQGACVVYLSVISENLVPILKQLNGMEDSFWNTKPFVISFIAVIIIWPLSLVRSTDKLAFSSSISICCSLYLVIFIVVNFIGKFKEIQPPTPSETTKMWIFNLDDVLDGFFPQLFLAIPCIVFAFQCHACLVPIFYDFSRCRPTSSPSLRLPEKGTTTFAQFSLLLTIVISLVVVMYMCIGISGFLTFQGSVNSNILLNFDARNVWSNIGRVLLSLSVALTYPIQNYAAKLVIWALVGGGVKATCSVKKKGTVSGSGSEGLLDSGSAEKEMKMNEEQEQEVVVDSAQPEQKYDSGSDESKTRIPGVTFLVISVFQFFFNIWAAILVPSLQVAFGFVGSIACSALMFLLPAFMFWKSNNSLWVRVPVFVFFVGVALFCSVSGVAVTIMGIV